MSAATHLLERAVARDPRALARAISLLEDDDPRIHAAVAALPVPSERALVVGFTGPPGAGKSTLLGAVTSALVARGRDVAALAVDPSSPITGGALLGDRVRLPADMDAGTVFFRSMATRGHRGGLARAAAAAVRLLERSGFDWVLVETVGVGQVELDVHVLVDVTVLVLPPGAGDGVQAHKAGILEIADVLCVNKADRPEAKELVRELEVVQHLGAEPAAPVVATSATTGEGIGVLVDAVEDRRSRPRGRARDVAAARFRLRQAVADVFRERLDEIVDSGAFAEEADAVATGAVSVRDAAMRLVPDALAARSNA